MIKKETSTLKSLIRVFVLFSFLIIFIFILWKLISIKHKNNWIVFQDKTYGFEISYPKSLNLVPAEINQKQKYKEYVDKCSSGEIDGCGGSRWPDFLIEFQNQNGKSLFSIGIHQLPVKKYGLAEFENNSFSYNIQAYSIDKDLFEKIKNTFKFIETEKPLKCLWSPEMAPLFDPNKDLEYIKTNIRSLSMVSGFYFEGKNTKKCKPVQFYVWTSQLETDSPPFKTDKECSQSCL